MLTKFRLKQYHGWDFNLGYIHISYKRFKSKVAFNISFSNWG